MTKNQLETATENKKQPAIRLLALNLPKPQVNLEDFKQIYQRVAYSSVISSTSADGKLIERAVSLIYLLIYEGGATSSFPVQKIENLLIDVEAARHGYIRWGHKSRKSNKDEKTAVGPRQFLYQFSRCHLLAFLLFRMTEMGAKNGDLILPKLTRAGLDRAKSKLDWLKQVKGEPTWAKVFRAFLNYQLSLVNKKGLDKQNFKVEFSDLTNAALIHLYDFEHPILLEARRGRLVSAPMPDAQFGVFLPVSGKKVSIKRKKSVNDNGEENSSITEQTEEYCVGEQTDSLMVTDDDTESERTSPISFKQSAIKELRKFLNYIVDSNNSYPQAVVFGEKLLAQELFSEKVCGDIHYLFLWIIERLKRGKKKQNLASSIFTYSQRLLYLLESFGNDRFSDLTLDDFVLFLSQYSTANAAKAYRGGAKFFHNYLKNELGIKVQDIDWNSPRLRFYEGYRERELLTEQHFQKLFRQANGSNIITQTQMEIVLLLLRRAGLRCGEIALLRIGDFHNITETRIFVRFSKSSAGKRTLPLHLLLDETELKLVMEYLITIKKTVKNNKKVLKKPFISFSNGEPLLPEQIGAEIAKIIKTADLPVHITAHSLRHAFASALFAAWWLKETESLSQIYAVNTDKTWARKALSQFCRPGIEERAVTIADDIRRLMGHASLEVTFERYIHTLDLVAADAVRLAEEVNPKLYLNFNAAASLLKITTRQSRDVFPKQNRIKPKKGSKTPLIELSILEKELIDRLIELG